VQSFLTATLTLLLAINSSTARAADLGLFTDQCDVGKPSTLGPGTATFDPAKKTYTVTGGGENMWASADHFHFVYKKLSGDVFLTATIEFTSTAPATGKPDNHRKACLMIRQSLDSDSVYADAALHGDGLTSLQFRETKGAITREARANVTAPKRLRIEKRGNTITLSVASGSEELHPANASTKIELTGDFYVGLAVSSHNTTRLETATFSDVELTQTLPTK
jgi:TolB protein